MNDINNLKDFLNQFNFTAEFKNLEAHEDARLRRFKDKWLFIMTLIALGLMFFTCIAFLLLKNDSSYTGTALNGIIGLTIALCGYYVRGKTRF
jgi:hypothetical protein